MFTTAGSRVGRGRRLTSAMTWLDEVVTVAGQTSILFPSIPPGPFRNLKLVGKLRGGGSDTVVLVQFNGDTSLANYAAQQIQAAAATVTAANFAPSATFANLASEMVNSSRTANIASNFEMTIPNYADTTWAKTWTTTTVDSSVLKVLGGHWQWTTPAPINQIKLITQNGQAFAKDLAITLYGF